MKTARGVRERYVEQFGEEQAAALERAANEHDNDVHSRRGSDPFKWALLITIGYKCPTKDAFRAHHGITVPVDDFKAFCREEADLGTHDGDCDFLALVSGAYNEYVKVDSSNEVEK